MSSTTDTAVVPFAVRGLWEGDVTRDYEDAPEYVKHLVWDPDADSKEDVPGWLMMEAHHSYKGLYVTWYTGKTLSVFVLNEDPYAAGGGCYLTVFSEDREALTLFLEDVGFPDVKEVEIQPNVALQQTL
jgi:hypothetical protein